MNTFEILAIIGALSWLPHIIQIIVKLFTKSVLSIIPDNNIEIGFTTLGPIINLSISFLSEKKMSLIKKVELEIQHETMELQKFTWKWFEEILLEMDIPKTGSVPYKKNQKAIAILVNENGLTEKKIGFQKHDFLKENLSLIKKVFSDHITLKSNKRELSELKTYESYNNLLNNIKNSFTWKVGNYQGKIKVYLPKNRYFEKNIGFKISQVDLNSLVSNLDIAKNIIENTFIDNTKNVEQNWAWVNLDQTTDVDTIKL